MGVRTFICWYANPTETPPDDVAARYDLVVGPGCPRERRDVLRRLNPDIRFLVYRNAIDCRLPPGISDVLRLPTESPAPEHVECAYEDIWRKHRDFLLRNRGARRPGLEDPRTIYAWGYQAPYDRASRHANRFFLDPRSGWKDFFPGLCADAVKAGNYDGVFCDNAGAHIEWIFRNLPEDLKIDIADEEWAQAMANLLTNVARRVASEKGDALIFANTCGDFVHDEAEDIVPTAFWEDARIHGAMDEFFVYAEHPGRSAAHVTEDRWREQVRSILCCEKLGRAYLAQSNGAEQNHGARIYSLASFLIGAGGKSAFNYNPAPGATYPLVYRFPEWDIDLGPPLRQYQSVAEALDAGRGKVYAREFRGGVVFVNPREAPAENVAVSGPVNRLVLCGGALGHNESAAWAPVGQHLTLPPHAAEIVCFRR